MFNPKQYLVQLLLPSILKEAANNMDILGVVLGFIVTAINALGPIKIVINDKHTLTFTVSVAQSA